MITKALQYLFSYSERALTPKSYSSLLQSSTKNMPLSEIMHHLYLYENNINVFDIDYFQRVAYSLLDFQKKMSVSEILTVLKLGMKHNVRNEMIWRHFEAELHRRLHNCMTPIFENQHKQHETNSKGMFNQLQAQSQDYYEILSQQFAASQAQPEAPLQEVHPSQQKKQVSTKDLVKKKSPPEITKFAYDLVQILIWYGCENTRLMSLLLQAQLHPLILKKTPNAAIKNAELLVYALQVNMKEYQSNKAKYTARSIKKIYKFQGWYFPDLMSNLKTSLAEFSVDQISYITEVISSFPVKKREHRSSVVDLISNEWKNREKGLPEQQKQKLEEILGKDQKLIAKFRKTLEITGETSTPTDNKQGEKTTTNQ